MYRAVGLLALTHDLPLDQAERLTALFEQTSLHIASSSVLLNGEEVGQQLQTPAVAQAASRVAELAAVRTALVARQRTMAAGKQVVMAGRDIGTVVLPDAPVKVYLKAPDEERARRRQKDMEAQGLRPSLAQVLEDLRVRDRRDEERAVSPLRPAPDAHVIETKGLTVKEVVDAILALARRA